MPVGLERGFHMGKLRSFVYESCGLYSTRVGHCSLSTSLSVFNTVISTSSPEFKSTLLSLKGETVLSLSLCESGWSDMLLYKNVIHDNNQSW